MRLPDAHIGHNRSAAFAGHHPVGVVDRVDALDGADERLEVGRVADSKSKRIFE